MSDTSSETFPFDRSPANAPPSPNPGCAGEHVCDGGWRKERTSDMSSDPSFVLERTPELTSDSTTTTTWPSMEPMVPDPPPAPLHALESRVAVLECRLMCVEQCVGQERAARASTPDAFDPFGEDPMPNPYARVFPEAVLQNQLVRTVGAPVAEQLALASVDEGRAAATEVPAASPAPLSPARGEGGVRATFASVCKPRADGFGTAPGAPEEGACQVRALVQDVLVQHRADASVALQRQLKDEALRGAVLRVLPVLVGALASDAYGCYVVQRAVRLDPTLEAHLRGTYAVLALKAPGALVVRTVLGVAACARRAVLHELLAGDVAGAFMNVHALSVWEQLLACAWDLNTTCQLSSALHVVLHGRWVQLAMHEVGSVAIQALLRARVVGEHSACVTEILAQFVACVCDAYGVWVVQHLVEYGGEGVRRRVVARLLSHVATVCLSAYGAKAAQAVLRRGGAPVAAEMAERLCRMPAHESPRGWGDHGRVRGPRALPRPLLVEVALTQQGCPLLVELLTAASGRWREPLLATVCAHATLLRSNKNGLRVFQLCGRSPGYPLT